MIRQFASVLSILAALLCQAQDYLANDPVWRVSTDCGPWCLTYDDYSYRTAGDSVIAGVIWTKVTRQGYFHYSWTESPDPPPDCQGAYFYGPELYGPKLLRQEGRQLRIWDNGSDQILYEFDLQVGDTLPLSLNNWADHVVVIAVDSILIGPVMRARYELGNSQAQYLVEGVGTSNGLLEPVSDYFDCGYYLNCFGFGSQGYYPTTDIGACDLTMRVDDRAPRESLSVAPVPASDRVTLRGAQGRETYTIYDPWGRAVLRGKTQQDETVIDLSALSNGMYSLVIRRSVLRVVVMRD